jgi:thymidylate kinase
MPSPLPVHTRTAIRAFFDALGSYVILRNHDIDQNLNRGGDIDVLVDNINLARTRLCEILGQPLFSLRRTYVESHFYEWGHIDLTPRMEWRGAVYISNTTILNNADHSIFGFAKPGLADEALICWFASLIWGGFVKERYNSTITQAARDDGKRFLSLLNHAVGSKLGARLFSLALNGDPSQSVSMVRSLRRALWLRGFARQPIGTLGGLISHYVREIYLRAHPPVPWFAIIGLDGSGKSTLISGLQQRLRDIGLKTSVYHWRPNVINRGPTRSGPVTNPHGALPRHGLTALAKIPCLILDWWVGFYGPIANQRAKGSIVIFDRYHADVLADPVRYRYKAARWWLKAALRVLPRPTAVVLLDAAPQCLQLRKRETTIEAAQLIRCGYLDIIKKTRNGFVIDACRDQNAVLDCTIDIFLAEMRNIAKGLH